MAKFNLGGQNKKKKKTICVFNECVALCNSIKIRHSKSGFNHTILGDSFKLFESSNFKYKIGNQVTDCKSFLKLNSIKRINYTLNGMNRINVQISNNF